MLRQFVADELLFNKARKLEYDRDPDVVRATERLAQQLAISKFVQKEVLSGLKVDPTDLETFFRANRERYAASGAGEEVTLDQVRETVQRDYLQMKTQGAYQELVERELQAAGAELFPERMSDG